MKGKCNRVNISKKLLGLVAGEGGGNQGGCAPVRSSKFVISIYLSKWDMKFFSHAIGIFRILWNFQNPLKFSAFFKILKYSNLPRWILNYCQKSLWIYRNWVVTWMSRWNVCNIFLHIWYRSNKFVPCFVTRRPAGYLRWQSVAMMRPHYSVNRQLESARLLGWKGSR